MSYSFTFRTLFLWRWKRSGRNDALNKSWLCVHAQSLQLCPTLCNIMEHSPPGSSVHGNSPGKNTEVGCHFLLQDIYLYVYIVLMLSHVQLFATPWTVTCQVSLSIEFSRQEPWSGLPFPTPLSIYLSIYLSICVYIYKLVCCTAEINITL